MPPAAHLAGDALRIRMYRVGFGDCFLVSLPVRSGHKHLLVDCGVHPKGNIGTMPEVLKNIAEVTGGELAAVVASHEHADHISHFGTFDGEFATFRIGEVWMPWAMDPEDPLATSLRRKRFALADALAAHFAATGHSGAALEILANLRGNERAVQALRSGFHGAARRVLYFKAGDRLETERKKDEVAGIPGLGVRVLGPPTDPELLKKMEPPTVQQYHLAATDGSTASANVVRPFVGHTLSRAKGRSRYGYTPQEGQDVEREIDDLLADDLEGLAFTLDSAVNNTSLVLLLNFRGSNLLFPGDAQWGNWKGWIESQEADPILEQLRFLKVAHHGSHNATPKRALERMTDGAFAALVSTQSAPWPSIPLKPLMERLEAKTKGSVFRSDSLVVAGAPEGPKLAAKLPKEFSTGKLWFDCTLRV